MNADWIKDYILKVMNSRKPEEYIQLRNEKLELSNNLLYKYCYVAEGANRNADTMDYNIDNFENDELFFQSPSKFNDPFDCYLGFSQNEIIKTLLVKELKKEKLYTEQIKKLVDVFLLMINLLN